MPTEITKDEAHWSVKKYLLKHASAHPEFLRHAIMTHTLVKGVGDCYCIIVEEFQKSNILFAIHSNLRVLPIGYTSDICRAFEKPEEEIISFGHNRIVVRDGILMRLADVHLKHNLEVSNQKGFLQIIAGYFGIHSPQSNPKEVKKGDFRTLASSIPSVSGGSTGFTTISFGHLSFPKITSTS